MEKVKVPPSLSQFPLIHRQLEHMTPQLDTHSFDEAAKRILIVDDNLAIHEDFKRILNPSGADDDFNSEDAAFFGTEEKANTRLNFHLDFATQGEDAYNKVLSALEKRRRYAVIFMDVRMPPGWDGVETTKKIWEADPDAQVVICTAYSDYSWDEMVSNLGHTDKLLILRKPFDVIEAEQAAYTFSKKWALTQESRQQEKFLEQTTELAPAMIFWVEQSGKIAYANQSACLDLQYKNSEIYNCEITEIISGWDKPTWDSVWQQAIDESNYTDEAILRTKDGEIIEADITVTFLDFQETKLVCISAQDVRERVQTLSELAKARDTALEAVQTKSQFLATMSHEIRTPMNGVVGIAQLLAQTALDETQREYVQVINQSGNALLAIINDILDSAKIESGKLEFKKVNFSLQDIIKESMQTIRPKADSNHVELVQEIDPKLPSTFNGDPGRLRQVLVNLMSNAVKFTHRGTASLTVTLDAEEHDHYTVRFCIKDSGIGISEENLKLIFQPFTQADASDSRKYGGTGLGLTITSQIIHAMHGEIKATSVIDKGTEFLFTIQLGKHNPTAPTETLIPNSSIDPILTEVPTTKAPTTSPTPTLASPNRDLKILVAEDNLVNQKVTRLQLQQLGLSADIVENGAEAIEALKNTDYDVILMDCQMPVLDGFETTREIRKNYPKPIRIIALTANAMKEDRQRCLDAGMDDYLSKPLRTEALAAMLNFNMEEPSTTIRRQTPEDSQPPVDDQRFNETTANDPDFQKQIITEYLQQAEETLIEIKAHIEVDNPTEIKQLAHKLAGSSATCGMDAIVPSLRTMENSDTCGKEGYAKLLDEAEHQFSRIRDHLTKNYP